jgi:large subunit ribosomal protein L30e
MKELQQEISKAVKSKTLVAGSKETLKSLLTEEATLIAVSDKAKPMLKNRLKYYAKLADTPCHIVDKSTMELGSMCGKPYPVSAFSIVAKK